MLSNNIYSYELKCHNLQVLRHDKAILHPIRQHTHLKHVPEYLIPTSMRRVAVLKTKKANKKKRKSAPGMTHDKRVQKSKMNDPLHSVDHQSVADSNTSVLGTTLRSTLT
jgi:hypothetical protein